MLKFILAKIIQKLQIPAIKDSHIDKTARVSSRVNIYNSLIGKYSYVGKDSTLIKTEIGKFCSIADNVIIGGASHPQTWISTSPVFHKGKNILNKNFSSHPFQTTKKTIIHNDVWIGNNVLIKSGITVSNGAIIGMGAVITKDVGPYEVWAGVPAKKINTRFNENDIYKLNEIQWWNWSEKKLEERSIMFNNPEILFKKEGF